MLRTPRFCPSVSRRSLARRILELNDEIACLDELIDPLVAELAPALLEINGVGTDCAAQFIVTAGENPERLTSEAAFAMLCGAAQSLEQIVVFRILQGVFSAALVPLSQAVLRKTLTVLKVCVHISRRLPSDPIPNASPCRLRP